MAALGHVPIHQRYRVLSGMRWTVWLSAVAVPFSAGTNLLLARVGPETIGVYGLLSVYIGVITAFLYFGGDTVVIRFIPECREEDRASFLVSYLLIILAALSGWLVVAHFFPAALRIMLGGGLGDQFRFFLLCLAPLPIACWMILASLKGILEIRFSQTLSKLVPILASIAYAILYLAARSVIVRYPFEVIWAIYLVLMAVLGTIGGIRLVQLCGHSRLRFHLPRDFWPYALATQQVGIAFFLAYRLDYVLVLNYGGLEVLGRYVAVMTIAGLVPLVDGFFIDTLLPSLTNMAAARNAAGAAQVFTMHMRILFLVATATSCAIMVLAVAVTSVMGAKYHSVQGPIILMTMVQGIANPGIAGGTLLASIGRQRLATWSCVLHVVLLTGLFFVLWPHWRLTGAVIASAAAVTVSCGSMMVFAMQVVPFSRSIVGLWATAASVEIAVGVVALWWMPLGAVAAVLVWIGAMALFLMFARYSAAERRVLRRMLMPGFESR